MHVSVILAVYNGAQDVEPAIESIFSQTYTDWDLLVVNDGSTDTTGEVLGRLGAKEPRLTVLTNEVNCGLAASLNRAWRAAKGPLIARLDADDVCYPERLYKQVEFLLECPDVAVLGTAADFVDEQGDYIGSYSRPARHDELVRRMYREVPFIHPTVVVRKSFYESMGGYDETLRGATQAGEDVDLWLRGYTRYKYSNLREPLIRYRVRNRQTFRSTWHASFVLFRSAIREGRLFSKGWYGVRPLIAWFATYLHLLPSHASRRTVPRSSLVE